MTAGRPTDYDPSYCDKVVEWGALGKSKTWMAAELDCTRQTLEHWAAANPEFLHALQKALTKSQAKWEDEGQDGLTADKFNGSVWSRSMAARFPDEWREIKGTELTGKDGGPIPIARVERVIIDPANTDTP